MFYRFILCIAYLSMQAPEDLFCPFCSPLHSWCLKQWLRQSRHPVITYWMEWTDDCPMAPHIKLLICINWLLPLPILSSSICLLLLIQTKSFNHFQQSLSLSLCSIMCQIIVCHFKIPLSHYSYLAHFYSPALVQCLINPRACHKGFCTAPIKPDLPLPPASILPLILNTALD